MKKSASTSRALPLIRESTLIRSPSSSGLQLNKLVTLPSK